FYLLTLWLPQRPPNLPVSCLLPSCPYVLFSLQRAPQSTSAICPVSLESTSDRLDEGGCGRKCDVGGCKSPLPKGREQERQPQQKSFHRAIGRELPLKVASVFLQLIPMIGFIGLGMGSAALYLLRLALRSPDVCWDRKNNPEPWNRLSPNDQYKFLAVSTDYKKLKKDRPDF
uniref:NDUFA4 mitochondrial complex associated like 2 n=1 Tax=Sus scrofa TaxID=9823 RepID=A0A8D1Y067_PIG